jgi:hypothetical protein
VVTAKEIVEPSVVMNSSPTHPTEEDVAKLTGTLTGLMEKNTGGGGNFFTRYHGYCGNIRSAKRLCYANGSEMA